MWCNLMMARVISISHICPIITSKNPLLMSNVKKTTSVLLLARLNTIMSRCT